MKSVENGAALLDEIAPGWEEKIDLETLDLGSSCDCVLGQLYRAEHPRMRRDPYDAYFFKAQELGLEDADAARLGFLVRSWRYPTSNLTAAWRRLIQERRKP